MNTCPLCTSPDFDILRDTLRYGVKRKVLKCRACTLVYLEAIKDDQDYYSGEDYRKKYGPTLGQEATAPDIFAMYRPYQHFISDRIAHLLTPTTSVLDVGCSAGQFLDSLKGRVGTRVGMEFRDEDAKFVREKLGIPVYQEPIDAVQIKEAPFDLITTLQVTEHVEKPIEFIAAFKKHLKPGGHIYIEVPNIDDVMLTHYHIEGYANFYYREPHLTYFSAKTLGDLLAKAGFTGKITSVQRYSFRNHLNWLLTGQPQKSFDLGNRPAWLVDEPQDDKGRALNELMARFDEEYKQKVGELMLGESLCVLAKPV